MNESKVKKRNNMKPIFIIASALILAIVFFSVGYKFPVIPENNDSIKINTEINNSMKKDGRESKIDINTVFGDYKDIVLKGAVLYRKHCANCHGYKGRGDGISSKTLEHKPRNFISSSDWIKDASLTNMYNIINDGIEGTDMKSYSFLPSMDRISIIFFIKSEILRN